jgi:hypothetical protein
MSTVVFSLHDAAIARRKQIEDAKREFERACERAAAVAQRRVRNADQAWESQRGQAHKIAVIRARLYAEHALLTSQELTLRLAIHQARLSSGYRPRISAAQRSDEVWYVRMIRSLLMRRGAMDDSTLRERRAADMEYGQRKLEALLRFRAAS